MYKLLTLFALTFYWVSEVEGQSTKLPSESQIIEIIKKQYGYPKDFPDELNMTTITLETKTFSLKTSTYYSKLVEKGVLKVESQENGVYKYQLSDSWKTNSCILENKNYTLKVKTSGLERIQLCKSAKSTGQNEAEFCLYTQYYITPFYDPINHGWETTTSWLINNVKLIKVNGIWKLKDPSDLKRKINTVAKP